MIKFDIENFTVSKIDEKDKNNYYGDETIILYEEPGYEEKGLTFFQWLEMLVSIENDNSHTERDLEDHYDECPKFFEYWMKEYSKIYFA